jgi:hypothetical protein
MAVAEMGQSKLSILSELLQIAILVQSISKIIFTSQMDKM